MHPAHTKICYIIYTLDLLLGRWLCTTAHPIIPAFDHRFGYAHYTKHHGCEVWFTGDSLMLLYSSGLAAVDSTWQNLGDTCLVLSIVTCMAKHNAC